MDKHVFEDKIFELVSFMIVSGRNLLEEPTRYGPFRLVDAVGRLINILEDADMSSERLRSIRDKIEEGKYSAMGTEKEFEEFLEASVLFAIEAMQNDDLNDPGSPRLNSDFGCEKEKYAFLF